jgi:hypothetical protein
MFQYAAGRSLALARGQSLRLDISEFAGYALHQGFELQKVFAAQTIIAKEVAVRRILGWQFSPVLQRILARPGMALFRRRGFVVEPYFHYWPEIKNVPRDCYLRGYWQSEKYFQEAAPTIRKDFTFKKTLTKENSDLAERIREKNAVSLHVRRGDYVRNPKTAATHGLCSLDYYQAAIRYISKQVEQPFFFIFSDDITWVKKHLEMNFPCRYIDHNSGADSYNDMHLMSLCRHHIIANSSFSWWGAWLSSHKNKIVVAPKKWFANDNSTTDLFPQGWVHL